MTSKRSSRFGFWAALSKLEFAYVFLLPWMAYIAATVMNIGSFKWMVSLGWVLMLVHQMIKLGVLSENDTQNKSRHLFILGPVLVIALNQGLFGGTIWTFFLEELMLESVALLGAIGFALLFMKGLGGKSAWKDMGPIIVVLCLLIFAGAGYGFATAWWETAQPLSEWNLISFGIAFLLALKGNIMLLQEITQTGMAVDIFEGRMGLILGQIGVWLFVIPLLSVFVQQ